MTLPNFYDKRHIFSCKNLFFFYICRKDTEIMEINLTKERITELITRKGMSKAEFAKRIGIERNNLDVCLNAKKKDINLVLKMAEALDLSLYDFLGLKEHETKEIYGCLYVKGIPTLVNSKEEIKALLDEL